MENPIPEVGEAHNKGLGFDHPEVSELAATCERYIYEAFGGDEILVSKIADDLSEPSESAKDQSAKQFGVSYEVFEFGNQAWKHWRRSR